MRRKLAFILLLCLFIVASKMFRLQLRQQKADYEAATIMRQTAEIITLYAHN